MTQEINTLPSFVQRPLWGAAAGMIAFLMLFIFWAVASPLATTVTLQGSVQSSQPSYALQHPYGGLVSEVLVDVHDEVQVGEELLRFNMTLERDTLTSQTSIRNRLLSENSEIAAMLESDFSADSDSSSPLGLRKQQIVVQNRTSQLTNENLRLQIEALQKKIGHAESQLSLMTDRSVRLASLSSQGFSPRTSDEQLQEQILIVRGEIEADHASIFNLQSQVDRNEKQQALAILAFQHELASRRQQNLEKLDQLESSILDLSDRIEKSVVRAPIAGTIASLPISAEHMIAARGATLVTLAQPLNQPRVSFAIPVDYIDQIQPGMTARLVIPSLPQRQMPKIDVIIDAISPRANVDDAGNPISFAALAFAEDSAFDQLFANTEIGNISEDMPIVLIVSVRETTFADYLVTPFLRAFSKALQD